MTDWTTRLTAADVEDPLNRKLEDWEDAIFTSTNNATAAEARSVASDYRSMTQALAMLNGSKSAVTTFLPGTTLAGLAASPHLAVGLKILSLANDAAAQDVAGRLRVINLDYNNVRDGFMRRIRTAKDNFPNSENGRAIATNLESLANGLVFRDAIARNTWCARIIENLGVVQLDQSDIEAQVRAGFRPVFEKLRWIIGESLRDGRSGLGRLFGTDPNYRWDGNDIHVEGPGARRDPHAWPGSQPGPGLRRASEDEIRTILTNIHSFRVERRSLSVGTGYAVNTVHIIEARRLSRPSEPRNPDIGTALAQLFYGNNTRDALVQTRRDVGAGVVSIASSNMASVSQPRGDEPPEAFGQYAAQRAMSPN